MTETPDGQTPPSETDDTARPEAEDTAPETVIEESVTEETAPESVTEETAPETAVEQADPDADAGTSQWNAYPGGEAFPGYPGEEADAPPTPPEANVGPDGATTCPGCDDPIERWASYCENCGQTLTPTAPMPKAPIAEEVLGESSSVATHRTKRRDDSAPPRHPCAECGGPIGDDLYCQHCGAKAPSSRDHFREAPASWVAGVCDRGIRHHRNEDALALAAEPEPGSRAVLVVCDGVSNAQDSHIASLAAARTARGVLTSQRPTGVGVAESRLGAIQATIAEAVQQANVAVVEKTEEGASNPPSCTFAVAIVEGDTVVYGNVGDSRVYWLDDDPARSQLLSTDDSVAQARIAMGVDRETAENGPQAHAITKWLGRDTPDLTPNSGTFPIPGPGWVLVCSDGLWNYASTAESLGSLAKEAIERNPGNQRVRSMAVSLVRWARQQGGRDNITVALARVGDDVAGSASLDPAQERAGDPSPADDTAGAPETPAAL